MEFGFGTSNTDEKTYSVAEINKEARSLLESAFAGVWLEAEVSEATVARSGHIYFKLADPGGKASIDAVMWRGGAMRYGSRIEQGVKIRCHGRVTLYEAGGRYQIVADRVDEAGEGLKAKALAELRAKLEAQGLFAAERKRPLPYIPARVGVVTSRTGAAVRDIIKVASRRFPSRIVVAHASVQGKGAASEIIRGLDLVSGQPGVEVVIIGRGGGSSEDLDAFNDEELVRAIARCPVPVISAVGHEVDVTLADLVADRRAATPSEAAELAVPEMEKLSSRLDEVSLGLQTAFAHGMSRRREKLGRVLGDMKARDPRTRLRAGLEALARSREVLARWPDRVLFRSRGDLAAAGEGLYRWPQPAMARARGDLGQIVARLQVLSPLASLERGYAVIRRADDGAIVKSPEQAPTGTNLKLTVARGEISARVMKDTEDNSR